MPIGEIIGEAVVEATGQIAMEAGGEAIKRRYGWKGCALTIVFVAALIGLVIWLNTR